MSRGLISFPVVVVFLVIGFLYYTTVFVVVDDWVGLRTSLGIMNAGAFTALASMVVFSYLLAIMKDPGSVPSSFVPDIEDSESPIQEIKRKGGDLRYCQKCSHYKPPRAHHCRVCKKCVLRMDHHCVWINNCVGHGNYKAFLVFVLYAVIACIHAMVMLLSAVTHDVNKDQQLGGGSSKTLYTLCGTILVPLTVALSILLGWHIYLVFHNKTTIEYHIHEGVRAMWLAEKVGHIYRNPYDLGVYENYISVLGPNFVCWLFPTLQHIGSGLRFRTSYDGLATVPS